jgi:hypothetical protein
VVAQVGCSGYSLISLLWPRPGPLRPGSTRRSRNLGVRNFRASPGYSATIRPCSEVDRRRQRVGYRPRASSRRSPDRTRRRGMWSPGHLLRAAQGRPATAGGAPAGKAMNSGTPPPAAATAPAALSTRTGEVPARPAECDLIVGTLLTVCDHYALPGSLPLC